MLDVDFHPELIHPTAFIAPGAVVVGQVTLGERVGVWFHASLRADTTPVTIGARTNIQEGAIFHADPGYPATIGEGVTVGHRAVVHGATVGDNVTIGMGAILLNGCTIGPNSIVGAGALVTQGKTYPPGVLLLGSPAKVARELTAEEVAANRTSAETYLARLAAFRARFGRGW
jgi:carbonic anhydrase/acetyltransferase-like protein (isoleucine patch superfamily)